MSTNYHKAMELLAYANALHNATLMVRGISHEINLEHYYNDDINLVLTEGEKVSKALAFIASKMVMYKTTKE